MTKFLWNICGNGNPAMCPIATYISGIRNTNDIITLCFILFRLLLFCPPFVFASYPILCTAFIISCSVIIFLSKSTIILLFIKLTFTLFTPFCFETIFSIWLLHALHDMPITLNFTFNFFLLFISIIN